ncbi:hypothetical protein [Pseudomonas sp.]|uniref:hypothetical protein n=1 Tax=Pseudomonas sp. TaxID=306 RepID=UPI0028A98D51|nr:hypothetical protein [Pseudomonas sp.]
MADPLVFPTIDLLPPPALPTDPEDVFDGKVGASLQAEQAMVPQVNYALTWIGRQVNAADGYRQDAAQSAMDAQKAASAANDSKVAAAKSAVAATESGQAQVDLAKAQVDLAKAQVTLAAEQARLATANGRAQVQFAAEQAQLATTNGQAQVAAAGQVKEQTAAIRDQAQIIADAARAAVGIASYTNKKGYVFTVSDDGTSIQWRPRHRVGEVLQAAGSVDGTFLPLTGGLYLQAAYPELFARVGLLGATAGDTWAAYSSTAAGFVLTKIKVGKDGVMLGKGAGTSTLYRSTDGGLTWTAISLAAALGSSSHSMYSFDTDKRGVWIATAYTSSTAGMTYAARSTDNGLTWTLINVANLPSALYTSMAADGNGVWIVGTSTQYLRRSADNGVTWTQVYAGNSSSFDISALSTDRQGSWVGTFGTNIIRSTDNGVNWSIGGVTKGGTIADLITDEKGLWVAVGQMPSGTNVPGISKSYDKGLTWSLATVTAPTSAVNGDAAYSAATDGVGAWYVGLASGKVVRSTDNTLSWQQLGASQTGFASNASITGLLMQNSDLLALSGGLARKSSSVTPYDSSTLFKVPDLPVTKGLTNYIKAKEVA